MSANRTLAMPDGTLLFALERDPNVITAHALHVIQADKTGNFCGAYTYEELAHYIVSLNSHIKKNDLTQSFALALKFSATSRYNVILYYNASTKIWEFISEERDIYQFEQDNLLALVEKIYDYMFVDLPDNTIGKNTFDITSSSSVFSNVYSQSNSQTTRNKMAIFSTAIFQEQRNNLDKMSVYSLMNEWQSEQEWIRLHKVTPEKAKAVNENNKTIWLHLAVSLNDLNLMVLLLRDGHADPNYSNDLGYAALHLLETDKHLFALNLLLEYGADPEQMLPEYGATPLHFALSRGCFKIAETLEEITKNKALPKIIPKGGWLIAQMNAAGYQSNDGGVCSGDSAMAGQSILAEEVNVFNKRKWELYQTNISHFQSYKNTTGKQSRTNLPAETIEYFDGIEAHQKSRENRPFFPSDIFLENDFVIIHQLIMSNKLQKQGGVVEIGNYIDIFKFNELTKFFKDLKAKLSASENILPWFMRVSTVDHRITISYAGNWLFSNANQPLIIPISEDEEFIKNVHMGLTFSNNKKLKLMCSIQLYCTKTSEPTIRKIFSEWCVPRLPVITAEKLAFLDHNMFSLLAFAIGEKNIPLIQLLLHSGANINQISYSQTAFAKAAWGNSIEILEILVEHCKNHGIDYSQFINPTNKNLYSPIITAAENFANEALAYLLGRLSANPNLINRNESSALMVASGKGNIKGVKILLNYKADPNLVNIHQNTAAHYAAQGDRSDVLALLAQHNGNLTLKNKKGFSPLAIAAGCGNSDKTDLDFTCIKNLLVNNNDIEDIKLVLRHINELINPSVDTSMGGPLGFEGIGFIIQSVANMIAPPEPDKKLLKIKELLDMRIRLESIKNNSDYFGLFAIRDTTQKAAAVMIDVIFNNAEYKNLLPYQKEFVEANELNKIYQKCIELFPDKFNAEDKSIKLGPTG